MRLNSLWIDNFKNMNDFEIDFEENNLTTVLIGENATGKSNLLEALVLIFRNLDLGEDPPFNYKINYFCRGQQIKIEANPDQSKKIKIKIGKEEISSKNFLNDPDRSYLPKNVFGYYSGPNKRLEDLFNKHQERFYRQLLYGQKTPLRPLFYARTIHSQYVLLSFFSFNEKEPLKFLKDYLGITNFVNAVFVLKQPRWYNKKKSEGDMFWGAQGVVRGFLNDLYDIAIAPLRKTERIALPRGRSRLEERIYLRIEDFKSLQTLASKYGDNVEFFKTLESTYISDLIHELKIRVKKVGVKGTIEFPELSEGEKQLLTVFGLLKFTKENESLFLLDEPDTHLHPRWKMKYVNLLQKIVGKNETSQVLIVTHDPLLIGGLEKEQIQIFSYNFSEERIIVSQSDFDPIGMGVAGLLTSDLFGLDSTLDMETQDKLKRKRELAIKQELNQQERSELKNINSELEKLGFMYQFRDPLYSKFLKALRDYDQTNHVSFSAEEREKQSKIALEIIRKIMAEKK